MEQILKQKTILRGRDHGLPSYGDWREFCGLEPLCDWNNKPTEISENIWLLLKELYSSPNDIDIHTAGLAETPIPHSVLGPTNNCIIGRQFTALKDGDRFFFTHDGEAGSFTPKQVKALRQTSLSRVMCDNTGIDKISDYYLSLYCSRSTHGGFRIVEGKDAGNFSDFVVGFFFIVPNKVCSASIVSSRFVVSAVHCLRENGNPIYVDSSCRTKAPKNVQPKIKSCRLTRNGDTRIRVWRRGAWIVRKSRDLTNPFSGYIHYIKYIYRPKGSYYGGEYNIRGGYDIVLLKLERGSTIKDYLKEPLRGFTFERLNIPSPDFQSDDKNLATVIGYGDARRTPCEVDDNGPSKFNYCGVEKNSIESKLCTKFLEAVENKSILKETEVFLFRSSGNNTYQPLTKCFATNPSKFGWCGTVLLTNVDKPDKVSDIYASKYNVRPENGWGFCSKSCFRGYKHQQTSDNNHSGSGKLRYNKRNVLNSEYCYKELYARLKQGFGKEKFLYEPHILCFARNMTFKTRYFEFDGKRIIHEAKEPSVALRQTFGRESNWYISHPGICYGDSGGPLIRTIRKGFRRIHILLGIASKGQGIHGHCGGSSTLAHFVRIKNFSGWLLSYIRDDPGVRVFPSEMTLEDLEKFKDSNIMNEKSFYSWFIRFGKVFRSKTSNLMPRFHNKLEQRTKRDDQNIFNVLVNRLSYNNLSSSEVIMQYIDAIDAMTTTGYQSFTSKESKNHLNHKDVKLFDSKEEKSLKKENSINFKKVSTNNQKV
ncbi:PXDN [Lepeophtheirus salmonis]|uniref:PXDN n=1 Tax=Lepeophtheirus salmonis TaxID=72036 RepID=A0A7R8D0M2_LEPSM|nr:PXDN [Lepeophtheirus salmonis]CAF2984095.1 PXDN [Lepeophtheirus salmonis]